MVGVEMQVSSSRSGSWRQLGQRVFRVFEDRPRWLIRTSVYDSRLAIFGLALESY